MKSKTHGGAGRNITFDDAVKTKVASWLAGGATTVTTLELTFLEILRDPRLSCAGFCETWRQVNRPHRAGSGKVDGALSSALGTIFYG